MRKSSLTKSLSRLYPSERLLSAPAQLAPYESDALTAFRARPRAVVLPCSEQEVVETVKLCYREKIPFVARGSGTSLSGGSLPLEDGIVIALNRLNKIQEIDPRKRIARVEPGVFNLKVSSAASPCGLYYAPDPSSQPVCTIGGNIAFNSGGAHCLKHGMTSNHVLGLRAVLPDGEVVEMGGQSLEQTGPDYTGLFVGSEGLFGIALEITLRLLPKPQAYRTVLAAYRSLAEAGDAVTRVIAAGLLPGAMEIMDRLALKAAEAAVETGYPQGAEAILIVELDGDQADVDSEFVLLKEVIKSSKPFEVKIAGDDDERARIWKGRKGAFSSVGRLSPDYVVQDGVVPRSHLGEALAEIGRLSEEAEISVANVFHAGDGNLHPLILYDGTEAGALERAEELAGKILQICIDMGGSITGEHGVGVEKRAYLPKMFSNSDIRVLNRIRDTIDPERLANRGKMLSCEGFPEPVQPDPSEQTREESPSAAFAPENIEEVSDLVLQHRRILVRGGGTKSAMISPSSSAAILKTEQLAGLVEYEPAEFIFTALAGTPLKEISEKLEMEGQFMPFDPALIRKGGTLGGAVASGTAGSGRYRYGGVRDFLIGTRFVSGLGEVVTGGGKVVKNAAGFDLPKLLVGSRGSLGVLVELTVKVFPRPLEYRTILVDYPCLEDAVEALHDVTFSSITFEAIDLHPPNRLLFRIGGQSAAVRKRAEAALRWAGSGTILEGSEEATLWDTAREFEWVPGECSLWKIPITLPQILELETFFQKHSFHRRYSVGGNVCWLASRTREGLEGLDGILRSLSLTGVPLLGKKLPSSLGTLSVSSFARRVKQSLDPYNRFPEI